MSEVSLHRLTQASYPAVKAAVGAALDMAGLEARDLGSSCLVKINAMSQEVLPGRNTGPWVVRAVLSQLRERFPGLTLTLADSDVAGYPQFARACRHWGYDQLAARFGASLVNLAREPYREVATDNPVCPRLAFPRAVFQTESIVNLPVLKTHVLGGISCCLKNHWGLLPRLRYQYHRQVQQVIAEINHQVSQTVFNLVDATVAMEGSGPKTGLPRPCGVLLAGRDRVACDSAALDYMGLPPSLAPHVSLSQAAGVGSMAYTLRGDALEPANFAPPALGQDIVSLLERRLRAIPGLGRLLYHPSIAPLLGWVGTMYNEQVWFRLQGRDLLAQVLDGSPWGTQFAGLPGLAKRGR